MLANSINILKKNYKLLLSTMFYALLVACYLIASANALISYRTGTHLTLLECLIIGLQGITLVLLSSFRNTFNSFPIIVKSFVWFFVFIALDSYRQMFSGKEYNLLSSILWGCWMAIGMTCFISKFSKK